MNKFDKPYRIAPVFDTKKELEMFNLACKLDTHELLQYSLINQVPFDISDEDGNTLIHVVITLDSRKASPNSKLSVIKFLVQQGVNPDKPNKYNQTPLHLACQIQSDIIVEYLLSIDVDANFKDNMGLTPFHYLLTGDIKTIDNNTEIMDFIPPPKNVNVKKNNELIEIKKEINKIINTQLNENFPIYKTIEQTIKNILESDQNMIDIRLNLESNIASIGKNTSSSNDTLEIKTLIEISENKIKKEILKPFNNFPDLNNLTIHATETNSWAHPTNETSMSLIKNGNIKRVIKAEIIKCKDEIIKLNETFKSYEFEDINQYDILELLYDIFKKDTRKDFNIFNDDIRHPDAIDNASSIINFKTLKYAGGPRNIRVVFPGDQINIKDSFLTNIIDEFKKIIKLSTNKQVLYMLDYHFNDDILVGDDKQLMNNVLRLGGGFNDITWYYYLAYYAIIDPNNIKTNEIDINKNTFAKKWYDIYINGCDISTWIFGMCTDLICKVSDSNLDCGIPFKLLMLIAGLKCNETSITQGIINAYKPHLINYINTLPRIDNNIKITKMVLMLLLKTNNNNIITGILSDDTIIQYTDLDKNINYTCTLINKYFTDSTLDHTNFNNYIKSNTPESQYYNKFKYHNNKPIEILCKIIFDNYNQMINKPLKQTILDFIYLLINYDTTKDTTKDTNIFNEISFVDFYMKSTPISIDDHTKNMLPSKYGYLNLLLDNQEYLNGKVRNKNHFIIAHLLGLYYEGSINTVNYNGLDLDYHEIDVDPGTGIYLLNNNIYPIPLNFISLNPDDNHQTIYNTPLNYYYYDITNRDTSLPYRDIILPDIYSYFALICKRIRYYQNKIIELNISTERIIKDLINGNVSQLKELYTIIYPQIVTYSKIIDNFNNSYSEFEKNKKIKLLWDKSDFKKLYKTSNNFDYTILASNLNNINSKYYLYYYIYSPNKLIKLSRFNYYQIPLPLDNATKYLYYSDSNSKIINIGSDNTNNTRLLLLSVIGSPSETIVNDKLNSGFINEFSLGNYDKFLTEYINGNFSTISQIENKSFINAKQNKLPPSLYLALYNFYTYTLIELIERVITLIDNNKTSTQKEIYNKIQELVKLNNINVDNYDLSSYKIIAEIIQEIVKEQYNIFINNEIYEIFTKIVNSTSVTNPLITSNLFTKKDMAISFETTNINLNKVNIKKELKNLYNLLIKPIKEDIFILYPNDLTNINRLKTKYGITINTNIINLLLKNRGSLHNVNMDNLTPIYSLLKNYNYKPIETLKTLGIDFRNFEGESPCEFLKKDLTNNLNKVLYNINDTTNTTIGELLNNFDNYLYNDVKTLILANEVFGNNILSYLPLSFNMSTYLTLQYLVENLINTDDEYDINDMNELFNFMDINISDINKNFLGETLLNYKIPNNFELSIAIELLNDKKNKLTELTKQKSIQDDNISKLKVSNISLAKKMEETSKYKNLNEDIKTNNADIASINRFIFTNTIFGIKYIPNIPIDNEYKIINRYKQINPSVDHNSLIMKAWEKIFNVKYSKDNYNLGLIQLLIKQQNFIEKLSIGDVEQLTKMSKGLSKLAQIGEDYFNKPKLTEQNKVAHFIRDMLEYISELTIATSLELIMRRILFTYFSNASVDNTIDDINGRIDLILTSKWSGYNKSLVDNLKKDIAPELAKNASEIFDNRYEEQGYNNRPSREVLLNFFQQLGNSPIPLSNEILAVFNKDVVTYFDTFISKSIMLWQINAENIFKYFINNYRCVKTLITL